MSTTDPSAAKPDGFAIGSISKRDRSGSGDEAATVYPVKHPTMSYAGAAKGRPAAQIYNVLNKQCIRHLTMSTTDPSAAKPDGFAIGSISKRDRSGSGDEAATVYPVKHPTMSYAGAAKGRPAAQ
ncbi:hypothetical protein BB560_003957, partial [Smittium megazygosporum]